MLTKNSRPSMCYISLCIKIFTGNFGKMEMYLRFLPGLIMLSIPPTCKNIWKSVNFLACTSLASTATDQRFWKNKKQQQKHLMFYVHGQNYSEMMPGTEEQILQLGIKVLILHSMANVPSNLIASYYIVSFWWCCRLSTFPPCPHHLHSSTSSAFVCVFHSPLFSAT